MYSSTFNYIVYSSVSGVNECVKYVKVFCKVAIVHCE